VLTSALDMCVLCDTEEEIPVDEDDGCSSCQVVSLFYRCPYAVASTSLGRDPPTGSR
jgi:hypothetical protein